MNPETDPAPLSTQSAASNARIVLEMDANGAMAISTRAVSLDQLGVRLTQIHTERPDRVLFVKAHPDVSYQIVIGALDAARGAGVEVLGAVLPREDQP